jgi:hypothetical protein
MMNPLFGRKCVARIGACLLVSGLLIPVASFSIGVAPAIAASCSAQGDWFVGINPNTSLNAYYVSANITTNTPSICGGSSTDSSSAWALIANSDETIPSGGGFAQSGYILREGHPFGMFAEYLENVSSTLQRLIIAAPPSGAPLYDTIYDFNAGQLDMYADNNTYEILETDFDPAVSWSSPWIPQWDGEVHSLSDNIPGTSSSPTYFSNLTIKTCRGCSGTAPTGETLMNQDSSRYGVAWDTTNSKFHIWTK